MHTVARSIVFIKELPRTKWRLEEKVVRLRLIGEPHNGFPPTRVVVCDPRKNKSMREGNQSDKIDARRLAELLRLNHLTSVYHGEHGLRTLKELVRTYLTVTKDLVRVMTCVTQIEIGGHFF